MQQALTISADQLVLVICLFKHMIRSFSRACELTDKTFKLHPISVYIGIYQGRGLGALLRRPFRQVLSVVAYLGGNFNLDTFTALRDTS